MAPPAASRTLRFATALSLLVLLAPTVQAQDPTVQPVDTQEITDSVDSQATTFPLVTPDGASMGETGWTVIQGTGNCCEHYLATTPNGRILDFGGTFIKYSDDRGRTWHQVQTPVPYVNGEGAIAIAPGGDVVGVGWDPYSGDQLFAHKYEADEDQWYYAPIPVHTPFHDRPWISVVPGPIETETGTSEQAVILDGWPTHQAFLASLDGLHYDQMTNQHAPLDAGSQAPPVDPTPLLDASQPHLEAAVKPLGGGYAIGPSLGGCEDDQQGILEPDLLWRCQDTDLPTDGLLTDGQGRLHHVQPASDEGTITYRTSEDAGETWTTREIELPDDHVVGPGNGLDMAINARLGQSIIAVRAVDETTDTHQDLIVRLAFETGTIEHVETLFLGAGDFRFGGSATSTAPRFDFPSVAMLPDGRAVAAFGDANHTDAPALAIEPLPDSADPSTGSKDAPTGQAQASPMARILLETTGSEVAVDGSRSFDPDGTITSYTWDWGDGATAHGAQASHAYQAPGQHTVTLTVEDDDGHRTQATWPLELAPGQAGTASQDGEDATPGPSLASLLVVAALASLLVHRRRR